MKQNITSEQLDELSDKGKERLLEWERKNEYDHWDDIDSSSEISELSIGQMIEFLGEDYKYTVITIFGDEERTSTEVVAPEKLCDDLWKAVKEVLEG